MPLQRIAPAGLSPNDAGARRASAPQRRVGDRPICALDLS
jgi:hypothetical protein